MTDIAYTVGDTAITVSYQGAQGPGVASGGTTGQVLVKSDSDDYSTEWATLSESDIADLGVYPDATGQAADKIAQTDGADGWTFVASPAASTVTSVNSQTGAVVLSHSDVSAAAESHTHTESEITDLGSYETAGVAATLIATHHGALSTDHDDRYYTEAEVDSALSGKADTSHSHTLSDVTDSGGAAALEVGTTAGTVAAGDHDHTGVYAAASHSHTLSDITDAGTAAASNTGDFATAAQGALADSATQPGDDADTLGSGAATDGQVLTADGAGGAAWEDVSAAGGPYALLGSTTLGSDTATIDVTGIDTSHDALLVVGRLLSDRSGNTTDDVAIYFGGSSSFDTTAGNYIRRIDYLTLGTFTGNDSSAGSCATTNGGNTTPSPFRLTMNGYATPEQRIAIVDGRVSLGTLIWENTSDALERVRVDAVNGTNFKAGSFLKVYGVTYGN